MVGLVDTSVFVAIERDVLGEGALPQEVAIPVPTLAELELGVLLASTVESRHRRLATFKLAQLFQPVPIDGDVPHVWAGMTARLIASGLRAPANDVWIAAIAVVHDMTVLTRDSDFDNIADVRVLRI